MATDTVNSASSSVRTLEDYQNSQKNSSNNALDKDAFLKLLVAQMSNQDPMAPSDNTEYIAQLTQFAILEQMEQMNATSSSSQAYDLVGKYVVVNKENSEDQILGKVDGTTRQDGIDYLLIGNEKYKLSSVAGMVDSSDVTDEKILQSSNLIGKNVSAQITGEDDKTTTITGQVAKISIKNGIFTATIDGHEVPLSSIEEITA